MFYILWNGKDSVTRRSTYAPYDSGGINMVDYENMVKALRLSWLKRGIDNHRNLEGGDGSSQLCNNSK